jgi:hypothetical protein
MRATRAAGLLAGLLFAASFIPAATMAQTPAPAANGSTPAAPNAITAPAQKTIGTPSARKRSESLIVLNAKGATLSGNTLVLNGVASSAILFASRPVRGAGHMSTPDLAALWSTGSFAKDPPNATVSAFAKDGSKVSDAVVVMKSVRLDGNKAVFDVAVLEGDLANADGPAAVFIDTIWFSLGSDGFNYIGRSQTTTGPGDPAIGSKYDTSTYSGWSNPAPSASGGTPVFRSQQSGGGYGYAPPPPDAYQTNPACGKPPLLPCY